MAVTNDVQAKLRDAYDRKKYGKKDLGILDNFTQQWFAQQSKDPWSALGAMIGYGIGAHYGEKEYQKQLGEADQVAEAEARGAYHDAALKAADESGLVGTSTYDGITQAKADYGTHKANYDDTMAKINTFKGDQESQEYKGLLEMAKQAEAGMQAAHNKAEMFRQINRDNGWSNDGYLSTNSLGEKLGDRSLYAPQTPQMQTQPSLLNGNGVFPTVQPQQTGTFTAPTITDLAQRSLNTLEQNPAGMLDRDAVARYYLTDPELKKKITSEYDNSKRSAAYWKDLRQKLRKEGLSEAVIDDYIDGKAQEVTDQMLGEYYQSIANGNYYGADALATLMTNLDPTLAQVMKTGGVSVGNLFGAQQNWLQDMAQAQRRSAERAETRAYNEAQYEKKRIDSLNDKIRIEEIKKARGLSGDSGGSSGGGKASSEETYTNNLILSALDALDANDIKKAEDFYYKAITNLDEDIATAKKISPSARSKFRQMLKALEDDIADAKNDKTVG